MNILLFSRPGYGKTFFVEQLAESKGYHLIELNASDKRTKKELSLLNSKHSNSVTGKPLMYFFDEVDSLDSGGASILAQFLREANIRGIPVYLSCNKLSKISKSIRELCKEQPFLQKTPVEIVEILHYYIGQSEIETEKNLKEVAINCKGDLRRAFHAVCFSGMTHYSYKNTDMLQAVNMILYEEDRWKVYDYIKDFKFSSIYSWLFETYGRFGTDHHRKMMIDINKNIHKVHDRFLHAQVALCLPPMDKRVGRKLNTTPKLPPVEEEVRLKLKEKYKCSTNESYLYLRLFILNSRTPHKTELIGIVPLTNEQLSYFKLVQEKDDEKKVKSLLEW